MRVFDITKTRELTEYDLELGHLKNDSIVVHYPEVQAVEEQSHIEVLKEYPNGGKDVRTVVDVKGVDYQPAHEEVENILVYVPYTEEELKQKELEKLRFQREKECFSIINRGEPWYDNLTDEQKTELKLWYKDWLDVTKTLVVPEKPNWLK